ncbi:MAG TPA: glycosyltransferase, partial [Actinophytocola sp.]|uniref:glycosyltransferase n=1 Tax=Actinophytocola sp. TaxID=1872138 RepID=UPI002DDD0C3D
MTDLCFVSADGGSAFMAELLEVVADAVRSAGGTARTLVGRIPPPGPDTVYVVVPHEYFVVTPDDGFPDAELCARTIGFCVEHPGTATFERNASLVGALGAAVDINPDSTAELRRRGIAVEHFQLGYSPLWDMWGGDPAGPRDVDVTYLGTAERRRSVLLGSYARELEHLRTRLFTPPHEMMSAARVDFLPGAAKLAHLARSRVLINLHRERKQALEWVRTLEAMCNGCVVVSEPSTDLGPLIPGEHLVIARPESLGSVAAALCADPDRERALRAAAYDLVRSLDLPGSAKLLIELAGSLLDGRTAAPAPDAYTLARASAAAVRSPENALAVDTPSWDVRFAGDRSLTAPRTARG